MICQEREREIHFGALFRRIAGASAREDAADVGAGANVKRVKECVVAIRLTGKLEKGQAGEWHGAQRAEADVEEHAHQIVGAPATHGDLRLEGAVLR